MADVSSECGSRVSQDLDQAQQTRTRSLRTDLINLLTRMYHMTIFASSDVTDAAIEDADAAYNVDDYGRDISLLDDAAGLNDSAALERAPRLETAARFEDKGTTTSTSLDDRSDRAHCCICLELFSESHAAFEIIACGHMVGKSCLSRWLNCTSPNANTCPCCRKQLFERPQPQPSHVSTLEEATQLWGEVEQTMAELLQLCEQRQRHFMPQVTIGALLVPVLNQVNYDLFLDDVGYFLEYEEGRVPSVLSHTVHWHT